MDDRPQKEHAWLGRLVGRWAYEGEYSMAPGQPTMKNAGTEAVRPLGGLWTIGEGECETPGGEKAQTVLTLGYDPKIGRFVGTFIASMMSHLWVYDGALDEAGKVLTLEAEGPGLDDKGTAKFRDTIEFVDDDHRVLTSNALGEDGRWHVFMTAHYRRAK